MGNFRTLHSKVKLTIKINKLHSILSQHIAMQYTTYGPGGVLAVHMTRGVMELHNSKPKKIPESEILHSNFPTQQIDIAGKKVRMNNCLIN